MKARRLAVSVLAAGSFALALGAPVRSRADAATGAELLTRAEQAYESIELDEARTLAEQALRAGGSPPAQLARIHRLLGIVLAALGREDESRAAYTRWLAIEPDGQLDAGMAPQIRSPYLDAAGYWTSRRFTVEAVYDASSGQLTVRLSDPLSLVRRVAVRVRPAGATVWQDVGLDARSLVPVAVRAAPRPRRVEHTLRALDELGNILVERGTDAQPVVLGARASAPPASAGTRRVSQPRRTSGGSAGWTVAAVGAGIGSLAALGGGVVALAVREGHAADWNDDDRCLQGGRSREANCSSDREGAESAEVAAIVGFAAGGALAIAAVVLLVAAPSDGDSDVREAGRESAAVRVGPGPVPLGASFDLRF